MPNAYSLPLIYDIAFSDRNIEGEVDFLLDAASNRLGRPVKSAIELACGPAAHCRAIARRGVISDGLDLSPEMVTYARELAAKDNSSASIYEGDMRFWSAPRRYDLAYCLLVSFAHLLTNDDIINHFNTVARLLEKDGLYIISHAHPRDFYGESEPSVERSWICERDGITVETDWGGVNQTFDPIAEIDELTISYTVTADGNTERFESRERLRRLSFQTFLALIRCSNQFEIVDLLGDFDLHLPLTHPDAVRMVALLRRI